MRRTSLKKTRKKNRIKLNKLKEMWQWFDMMKTDKLPEWKWMRLWLRFWQHCSLTVGVWQSPLPFLGISQCRKFFLKTAVIYNFWSVWKVQELGWQTTFHMRSQKDTLTWIQLTSHPHVHRNRATQPAASTSLSKHCGWGWGRDHRRGQRDLHFSDLYTFEYTTRIIKHPNPAHMHK